LVTEGQGGWLQLAQTGSLSVMVSTRQPVPLPLPSVVIRQRSRTLCPAAFAGRLTRAVT
jgi:hypothetical protein